MFNQEARSTDTLVSQVFDVHNRADDARLDAAQAAIVRALAVK